MKILISLLFLLLPYLSIAQSKTILTTKYFWYAVEIDHDIAQLTTFNIIPRMGGKDQDSAIQFLDTLKRKDQSDTFIGKKATIKTILGQTFLFVKASKKTRRYQLSPLQISSKEYYHKINQGIWNARFNEIEKELAIEIPPLHIDYLIGRRKWKEIQQKDIPYQDFFAIANTKKTILKDSIVKANKPYFDITSHIQNDISTISYAELKEKIQQLPLDHFNTYLTESINSTCENNPEYYFRLVEDLPINQNWLFDMIGKKARKKIKRTKTNSPIKRAYLKHHRRTITKGTLSLSGMLLYTGGLVYGIVWLVKK